MPSKTTIAGLIFVLALISASLPFQRVIDDMRGKFRSIEGTLYLSSSTLKTLSLGYTELVADIYWLRSLQYFGGDDVVNKNPELLYHYFDIITDLDPQFTNAYRYGGTFLAEPPPIGLGDIERGVALFDKGRANNPDNFRLPFEEAFIYYLYAKNYDRAADLFDEASKKPGLSDFRRASLKGMAASAHSKTGSREVSRRLWGEIYENTQSEGRRLFALERLKELAVMDDEDRLTGALAKYIKTYGATPSDIEALKGAGFIDKIPKEILGGRFIIAETLPAVKSSTLAERQIKADLTFLNAKSRRFKLGNKRFPVDWDELRRFIESETTGDFPAYHPLGGIYAYNPETGVIESN
ncbi:MAG: tetratricopeptide repeat protein [Deltaproteobacteria bacterium]